MGIEKQVDVLGPFDGAAPVFHNPVSVFRHMHARTEGIKIRIRRNGAVPGKPQPGKDDPKGNHPGMGDAVY